MKCYIGLGSNLGDRLENLERAAQSLKKISRLHFRVSPIFSTPALVPNGAPESWRIPFFNAVVEMEWNDTATALLHFLKKIEQDIGRTFSEKWAPRIIDLDILLMEGNLIHEENLKIPHTALWDRSFVLDPLKHLAPLHRIPPHSECILSRARALSSCAPLWMGILNLTPDSFSDGGVHLETSAFAQKVSEFEKANVQIFDLGAESTRPGATPISSEEEWRRLKPALEFLRDRYRGKIFKPRISVDTRHASVALNAIEYHVDCINDVSGTAEPQMLEIIKSSRCDYVLMHSLSVPADPQFTLSQEIDPVKEIKIWAYQKLELLVQNGISIDRVIFDPGIGFGKTAEQSLSILRKIDDLLDLPVRILIGHSRKSFLKNLNDLPASDRDPESIGISLQLAQRGVDILRVHEAHIHSRAFMAFQEVF